MFFKGMRTLGPRMSLGPVLISGSLATVFPMNDDWYYAQNNERKGPVSFTTLKAMAADGWLAPDDLVWRQGMSGWIPARDADGLSLNPFGRVLHKTIAGLRPPSHPSVSERPGDPSPPSIPPKSAKPTNRRLRAKTPEIQWGELSL